MSSFDGSPRITFKTQDSGERTTHLDVPGRFMDLFPSELESDMSECRKLELTAGETGHEYKWVRPGTSQKVDMSLVDECTDVYTSHTLTPTLQVKIHVRNKDGNLVPLKRQESWPATVSAHLGLRSMLEQSLGHQCDPAEEPVRPNQEVALWLMFHPALALVPNGTRDIWDDKINASFTTSHPVLFMNGGDSWKFSFPDPSQAEAQDELDSLSPRQHVTVELAFRPVPGAQCDERTDLGQ